MNVFDTSIAKSAETSMQQIKLKQWVLACNNNNMCNPASIIIIIGL